MNRFGDPAARRLRRSGAITLTACVHVALIWLIVTRSGTDVVAAAAEAERLKIIDLDGMTDSPPPPAAAAVAATSTAPAEAHAELELTAPTAVPPEWTVSRIALPPAAPPQAQAAAGPTSTLAGNGAGAWDPFAGAAPLRQEAPGGGMDQALLKRARDAVARRFPGQRGTIALDLQLSPDGIVFGARPAGGTASRAAQLAMIEQLVGMDVVAGGGAAGGNPRRVVITL